MKIYSHWTDEEGDLERTFFARREQQETHRRMAEKAGKKVLAKNEYTLAPTAEAITDFLNDRCRTTSYDLAEEFAMDYIDPAAVPSLEDMLS